MKLTTQVLVALGCFAMAAPAIAADPGTHDQATSPNGGLPGYMQNESQSGQMAGTAATGNAHSETHSTAGEPSSGQPGYMENEAATTQGMNSGASQTLAQSPKDACDKIIDAAKRDDFAGISRFSIGLNGFHKSGSRYGATSASSNQQAGTADTQTSLAKNFHRMRQQHMAELKSLSCGSQTVVGDHAFVQAKSDQGDRLIPFLKQGDNWMFDSRTYMSFYRESMPGKSQSRG